MLTAALRLVDMHLKRLLKAHVFEWGDGA